MDWDKFWELYHKAWGHCKESPEYDKPLWKDMQYMLQGAERDEKDRINDDLEQMHMRG
jgi:hypothetical protein